MRRVLDHFLLWFLRLGSRWHVLLVVVPCTSSTRKSLTVGETVLLGVSLGEIRPTQIGIDCFHRQLVFFLFEKEKYSKKEKVSASVETPIIEGIVKT